MKKIIHMIIMLTVCIALYSQSEWQNFQQKNTLFPSNPYKVIAIDSNTNKWIGTEYNGILKFDGTNWEAFKTTNSALSSNKINSMIFDFSQNLWIATTGGGLIKKTPTDSFSVFNTVNSFLPTNNVNWVEVDEFNNKWIATKNGLLLLDSYGSESLFNMSNTQLPSNDITTVQAVTEYIQSPSKDSFDVFYTKWIGTAAGLVRYNNINWQVFTTSNSLLTGNGITALKVDNKKNKWIGVYNWNSNTGGGLIKIDSTNTVWTIYNTANSNIPSNNVRSIDYETDANNNTILWITTDNGIGRLTGNTWTVYNKTNTQNNLPVDDIYAVTIENGVKWFGTSYNMMKLTGNTWTPFNISNAGIPNNHITDIVIEKTNNYSHKWFATKNGLSRFTGTNWTVFNMANSPLPSNDIKTLAIDNTNTLWIGTMQFGNIGGGLATYNTVTKEWGNYNTVNSAITSNSIIKVAVENNTNVKWVGTAGGGLIRIEPNIQATNWQVFNNANSPLSSDFIQDIFIDSSNNKWIATDYGISVIGQGNAFIKTYNTFNSNLPSNNVNVVKQDKLGFIWAITPNSISKLVNDNWIVYNSTNTPVSGVITDLDFDSNNIKWISSENGLFRTDEMQWTVYNTGNSSINSNNLKKIKIEDVVENNKVKSIKWIATVDSGVVVFRGGEQQLPTGTHLSVLQHTLTPNTLKISAIVNNVLVDSVSFKINNKRLTYQELAQNTYLSHYTVTEDNSYRLDFKYFSSSGDSLFSRNFNFNIFNETGNKKTLNIFELDIVSNLYEDTGLLSNIENDILEIPFLPHSLKDILVISSQLLNPNDYVFQINTGDGWKDLNTEYSGDSISTKINRAGKYRLALLNNTLVNPIIDLITYPNPFSFSQSKNANYNISFNLEKSSEVSITVFDVRGRKVDNIYKGFLNGGKHNFTWNLNSKYRNNQVASGMYFIKISTDNFSRVTKSLIIK